MMATSTKFRAARKRARPFAIACDYPDQQGSMQPTVPIPDLAAHLRGLSNSSKTRRRLRWPPLRSFASRGSVRDRLRSPATTRPSRVQCTPPFLFLTAPHLRAALALRQRRDRDRHGPTYDTSHPAEGCPPSVQHLRAVLVTQVRRIADRGDHLREVSRPAEACATISDHPDQQSFKQPTVPIPDLAARRPALQSFASCYSPPFPFQTALHLRAALAIRHRCDYHHHGPTYDTSRPAEACTLTCAASHPNNPVQQDWIEGQGPKMITHRIRCTPPSGGVTTNIFDAHIRVTLVITATQGHILIVLCLEFSRL
ncbi:hypothetical protein EDB86DRAFT_3243345 [Lactarius hatsudake]|nr:hypothetical protein EDB86DRAFT_3243345 [Lactarius hatsudake]